MTGKVIANPRRRRFSHSLLLLNKQRSSSGRLLSSRLHHHIRRREAPQLTKVVPSRKSPEPTRMRTRGSHDGPHAARSDGEPARIVLSGVIFVGPDALPEYKRSGTQQGLVIDRRRSGRRQGSGISPAADGNRDGGEAGGDGPSAGGGYDRRLGLTQEPLDGLTVGFMAQLASQLEDTSGTNDGHPDSPSTTIDFAVTVLGGRLLNGE
ncbi:hypothetical protein GQ457_04G004510 [Hibiscus cannabinus]